MFKSIALICTGNICRSPMADAMARQRWPELEIFSAGTAAVVGARAEPNAVDTLQARGIDLQAHRAQQATEPLLRRADLILCMDASHSHWINRNFPVLRGRVHKIGKWRGEVDVHDPYLEPRAVFEEVADLITLCLDDWQQRMPRR